MEDPSRPKETNSEGLANPQEHETPSRPHSLITKIDDAISSKPQISKLEFSKSPPSRSTKVETSTSQQNLAAKLEATLDSSNGSRGETNSLNDSRNESEPEDETTNDKESEDENANADKERESGRPLMNENDTVRINLKSDEEPTLPMHKKKENSSMNDIDRPHKEKPPIYLFPVKRMELAWTRSANICEFLLRAILIIFSTLGWLFCIGGVPFVSVAMLIVGSIFIDDCKLEPNIPIYLIVAGVLGTIQHVTAIWTKYLPKDSQGRVKEYRSYCICFDSILHLFLAIWFVIGCIWIYGAYQDVNFTETYKDEYCHKALYLFAFWILNISFIILMILIAISLFWIISLAISS